MKLHINTQIDDCEGWNIRFQNETKRIKGSKQTFEFEFDMAGDYCIEFYQIERKRNNVFLETLYDIYLLVETWIHMRDIFSPYDKEIRWDECCKPLSVKGTFNIRLEEDTDLTLTYTCCRYERKKRKWKLPNLVITPEQRDCYITYSKNFKVIERQYRKIMTMNIITCSLSFLFFTFVLIIGIIKRDIFYSILWGGLDLVFTLGFIYRFWREKKRKVHLIEELKRLDLSNLYEVKESEF